MAEKKFQKKFMHPTRRKLVEMVHTGEYDANTQISTNKSAKKEKKREIGEQWTDNKGNVWVQKAGYKIKKTKNTDSLSKIRKSLESKLRCKSDECEKKGQYGSTDKALIKQLGYCTNCLVDREVPIRNNGDFELYAKYRLYHKAFMEGNYFIDQLTEAKQELKQEYEVVDGDGQVQKWKLERPVEEMKAEIDEDIDNAQKELKLVTERLTELYSQLKDKEYILVQEMKEQRNDRNRDDS